MTATRHLTFVWGLLVAATVAVGWLAEHPTVSPRGAVAITFAVAGFKARWVLLHFMELRHAPLPWRLLFESWALLCVAGLVGAYWFSAA